MTVITASSVSEKKLQKEPLVGAADGTDSGPESSPRTRTLVRVVRQRLQPVSENGPMVSACAFVSALLLFCAGMAACGYLYQQYQGYQQQQRHFRGWCGIPLASEQSDTGVTDPLAESRVQMQALLDEAADSLNQEIQNAIQSPRYFDEEFDLDLEFEKYEKIDTPDFSNGRKGRFVHDFGKNKTGIVDLEAGRCFVMELNRTRVVPPRNMFDMIEKMRSGYYDIDTEVIHETYRVVTPAIPNGDSSLGSYINEECSGFPIYRLEQMTSPVFKRSVSPSAEKTKFMEFAGQKFTQMNIENLDSAPGRK